MSKPLSLLFRLSLILLAVQSADACTSIRIKTADDLVFYARTMEGAVDYQSKVTVVPKGTIYHGTLPDNSTNGLAWSVNYGFVGMNAFGSPLLTDGMNEKGLAVGNLFFPDYAEYQTFDPKKSAVTLAQYEVGTWLLSTCATVEDVRQEISKVQVVQGPKEAYFAPLHFAVHDAKGNSLVIEFVKGKLHIYDNPLGVMTNSPSFDWMITYLSNFVNLSATNVPQIDLSGTVIKQFGQGSGLVGLPGDFSPPSRFVRMVAFTQSALPVKGAPAGLNMAMTIINNVDIPPGSVREKEEKGTFYDITQWVVVADLTGKKYYFHSHDNKNWRSIDLMKALQGTTAIKTIELDVAPEYPDETAMAK
jgi:choloylglycine hydrolase